MRQNKTVLCIKNFWIKLTNPILGTIVPCYLLNIFTWVSATKTYVKFYYNFRQASSVVFFYSKRRRFYLNRCILYSVHIYDPGDYVKLFGTGSVENSGMDHNTRPSFLVSVGGDEKKNHVTDPTLKKLQILVKFVLTFVGMLNLIVQIAYGSQISEIKDPDSKFC